MRSIQLRLIAGLAFAVALSLFLVETASANQWAGGSRGYGSVGSGSVGSGSVGYGSVGYGRGGLLFNGRRPVRNLLGRVVGRVGMGIANVRDRVSYRMQNRFAFGGYYAGGSVGSSPYYYTTGTIAGGSTGTVGYGSTGYAASASGVGYGSWGQSYLNSLGSNYQSISYDSGFSMGSAIVSGDLNSVGAPLNGSSMSGSFTDETGYYQPGIVDSVAPANLGTIDTSPVFSDEFGTPLGDSPADGGIITNPSAEPPSIMDPSPGSGSRSAPLNDMETPPTPGPQDEEIAMTAPEAVDAAILSVRIPREAKVFINGHLTRTEGELRSYVSKHLKPGQSYDYYVRAVLDVDGKEIVRDKKVSLSNGIQKTIGFDFSEKLLTRLAVKVPEDATVTLAGKATSNSGQRIRYFTSESLKSGESWKDYKIEVSVVRDGKTLKKERTIELEAGTTKLVRFDFDSVGQIVSN